MNRQALKDGAVGSLSECADAWCRPGQTWARRSGTFLQSWSNSEHLRVWSQYFLGMRPDMLSGVIVVAPRMPMALNDVETILNVGSGQLEYVFKRYDDKQYLRLALKGQKSMQLCCDLPGYKNVEIKIRDGETVDFEWDSTSLSVEKGCYVEMFAPDAEKQNKEIVNNDFFDGLDFAVPCYRENLKTMSRYFNPPLDYYSVE